MVLADPAKYEPFEAADAPAPAPGGIAALLDFKNRKPLLSNRAIVPQPALLKEMLPEG